MTTNCAHGFAWRSMCWQCRREDELGDRTKQPPGCDPEQYSRNSCPNMKEVGGGMEGERYDCTVCGAHFFLDYEEMK